MIIKNQSIEDYHASSKWVTGKNFKVSSSTLKYAKKSTRDFIHYVTTPSETKPHFDFGNAFELYLMDEVNGTTLFKDKVAVMPDQQWINEVLHDRPTISNVRATGDYKNKRSTWDALNEGKYIIPDVGAESFETMQMMSDSVLSNELILSALQSTDYQVSLEWEDELTVLTCKTRPDLTRQTKNTIIDIKTIRTKTTDASPDKFYKEAAKHDYPLQAFMQVEGAIKSGYYDRVDHYYWLVCEKKAPYHYAIYRFDNDDIESIRDRYNQSMMTVYKSIEYLKAGVNTNHLPSYGERSENEYGVLDFKLPSWY